jgi:hypothetical protein
MTVIEDQTFESETIIMDGKCFKNCTLSGCTLVFCGGDYYWIECRIGEPIPCILKFQGPAGRTITYLKSLGKLPPDFATEDEANDTPK